ncbi:MAG: M1 family metallopeptidase [Gemmatimonadota bacterium]|nr:M1 family metallopeptidase [Gemmatimonadota bacterium]
MRGGLTGLLSLLLGVAAPMAAQQGDVDVERYRFYLTLPDTGKHIRVQSTTIFRRDSTNTALRLDLLAPMAVRGAYLGCATALGTPFRFDGRVVTVPLGEAGATGDTTCVSLIYEGEPADGLVISTDSAGRWLAFGDNWPDRARHWLATVDHPSDKALVEFIVDAPATLTVVANGTRRGLADIEPSAAGPRRRTVWETAEPIATYLMVIAAAPLVETPLGETACGYAALQRCVPQSVFTAPEQARYMPGNFARAGDIVRFFAQTVSPFPYERLSHLQSATQFGGMENVGAIFYADGLFRRPDGVGVGLIAHETAHQWFGDAVTEGAWGHLWLSEGFATYFAALYTQYAMGDSAFRAEMANIRQKVIRAGVVAARPVVDTAQTDLMELLNENSYEKGGFVLHMLRSEVGDSTFFRAIRAYYEAHRNGNALTGDLLAEMERESARDLGWFFDQWLTRPGYIDLALRWEHDIGAGSLTFTVTQGDRFPPYRFPLRVEIVDANGVATQALLDVPAERAARIVVPGRWTAPPLAVRPDPMVELLAAFRTS